jgi:hypothetical protein
MFWERKTPGAAERPFRVCGEVKRMIQGGLAYWHELLATAEERMRELEAAILESSENNRDRCQPAMT